MPVKLQTTPAETETPSAEAEIVPTYFAVTPAMVPKKLIKLISQSLAKS